ncbi:unnamed protein product [Caenorhabditis bovis]|uniref:Uncharacterized protein n=1 Tax=Caenorhabditis bovis TaxID=2654633 RepID=A0A8S1ESA6_9PELO|nr:unnamed protein product [Caenorhabditis bovis]
MIRPPMRKLMISNRSAGSRQEDVMVLSDGTIVKSPTSRQSCSPDDKESDVINYSLLQDVLSEGYKIATLYDPKDHIESIAKLRRRLKNLFANLPPSSRSPYISSLNINPTPSHPHFYLSPSSTKLNIVKRSEENKRVRHKSQRRRCTHDTATHPSRLNFSQSTGDLNRIIRTPYPTSPSYLGQEDDSDERKTKKILKSPPPPERIPSSIGDASDIGEISIFEASKSNMDDEWGDDVEGDEISADQFTIPPATPVSLSCLEDMSNFQRTQYMVFPMRDSSKKPYLIKFPDDLHEEEEKINGSIWGSDTSLEEEFKLASQITAGIVIDDAEDSPIQSPAPILGDLV